MNLHSTPIEDRESSLEHMLIAGTEFARLVSATAEPDWVGPTPCTRWNVRDLIAHTLSIAEALVRRAHGNDSPPQVRVDELHSARHTCNRFTLALERGWRAWSVAPLAEFRHFPWGRTPARVVLDFTMVEFVAHGWDLATAIGAVISLPERTIEAATVTVETGLLAVAPRGDFADAVPIPPRSSSMEAFVALVGRSPGVAIIGEPRPSSC